MSRVGQHGQISEINKHLYLSGSQVLKPEKLKQKRIESIINVTTDQPNAYLHGVEYMKVRVEDSPCAHLSLYFDQVAEKIHANHERGINTLVHCVAGVSRSATLCIVYLVRFCRMSLRQAYLHVKQARPIIRPNVGFWAQMIDYEKRVNGFTTVDMIPIDCNTRLPDVYVHEMRTRHQKSTAHHTRSPSMGTPLSRRLFQAFAQSAVISGRSGGGSLSYRSSTGRRPTILRSSTVSSSSARPSGHVNQYNTYSKQGHSSLYFSSRDRLF